MSLQLVWSSEQTVWNVTDEFIDKLEQILQAAGQQEQLSSGEVALSFVDDEAIRQLNQDYRGIDYPTDVLSFAMQELGEGEQEIVYEEAIGEENKEEEDDFPELLGDIIISIPRAIAQAEEYGHSLEREVGFLFVHGFLHLIGYDHQDQEAEQQMTNLQELILQKAGLTR